jgi:hypothetical protein
MPLRTVQVRVEPSEPHDSTARQSGVVGTYTVEVDSNLSPEEVRAAALEAVCDAVEIDDPTRFKLEVL